MNIIAIFGISGVGKTTLIQKLCQDNPNYVHLQAGTLIRRALKNIPRDQLRITSSEQIIKNQYLLIDEFWKEIEEQKHINVIFDGHSIIDNNQGIIQIPSDVIKGLKPKKIVFIEDNPEAIFDRKMMDHTRDRSGISPDILREQQDKALTQAKIYADELSLPFHSVTPENFDLLKRYVLGK